MKIEKPKLSSLCSDNQMSAGKLLARPARDAPAPRATISAGRAQHSKVELLANNARRLVMESLFLVAEMEVDEPMLVLCF
jgi:hypothetical protein